MSIQESGENYLETILLLEMRNGIVRNIDIANKLEISNARVSRAMDALKKAGYIDKEAYGTIHLTERGRKHANEIYDRHIIIKDFLMSVLSIDAVTANTDACRIEHVISPITIEHMRKVLGNKKIPPAD